jgi:hypothetical protein
LAATTFLTALSFLIVNPLGGMHRSVIAPAISDGQLRIARKISGVRRSADDNAIHGLQST